ncbi:hypothetical protein M9Y10_021832 [Tritrichomonas musculus]|uniref:non-specific serine/threonine protein kinase n=1 Tax=Tritrichomonas musculus TaxID=1915356 RepID=A0ABR2KR49_9EUKA
MSSVIGCRYRIREKIGMGSFGVVNRGDDIRTGRLVAIKIESKSLKFSQLEIESNVYKKLSGSVNIPRFHYFTHDYSEGSALVIDLEGPSVEDLKEKCGGRLSLKTVLMLADQMLSSIEFVHKKGLIHRDIKPDNFVIGNHGNENQLFLIDFGLSKSYKLPDGTHIRFNDHRPLTGTARYASISTLSGNEQSRRDDMESLGYIWIYLLKGLPWINLTAPTPKIKYDKILAVKMMTPTDELCSGLPYEFGEYLNLVKQLQFNQEPEYSRYRKMFRDLFNRLGYIYDYKFDWCNENEKLANNLKNRLNSQDNAKSPHLQQKASNQKLTANYHPNNINMENRENNKNPNPKEDPIRKEKIKPIQKTNLNTARKNPNQLKPKKAIQSSKKKITSQLDGIPQFHSLQRNVKFSRRSQSAVRTKK